MKYIILVSRKLIIFSCCLFCLILLNLTKPCIGAREHVGQVVDDWGIIDDQVIKIDSTIELTNNDKLGIQNDSISQEAEYSESEAIEDLEEFKKKFDTKSISKYFLYLFFSESEVLNLKASITRWGKKYLPQYLHKSYSEAIDISFQYPIIIFLSIFILFFILNINVVLLVLNYSIRKKNQKVKYVKFYSNMYEQVLLAYMFKEIGWEQVLEGLKQIRKRKNRKILVSILFNLHENLRGEVDKFIPEVFFKLDLHKDALRSAKSLFTHKKVQAIRELTYLYSEGANQLIPHLINDPNDSIRAEAQTAYIRLNPKNPFNFLKIITRSFSRWTQLSAFYLFRLHQLPVPSFAGFLYSKHFNVRNFSLRMINFFQQLESVSEIFNMLESTMEETRYLSYKAINDLRIYDGRTILKRKYRYETGKNMLEIVRAFRNIGNEDDIDFLEIIVKSESISLKIEACRSLYYMNSKGRARLLELNKELDNELDLFIAHVTDPRN